MEFGFHAPTWSANGYQHDEWIAQLKDMKQQTKSTWVGIEVAFNQPDQANPHIDAVSTVASVKAAIQRAHAEHMKVFLRPILMVHNGYAGSIHYKDAVTQKVWFTNYETKWLPFVQLAQQMHVEQLGIATEFTGMQSANAGLWNHLIQSVANLYHGPLTVDLNWDSVNNVQPWMFNRAITYIGVDAYFPLETKPDGLSSSQIEQRWNHIAAPSLHRLSQKTGKLLLLSEVGFGNDTEALVKPYDYSRAGTATPAPKLQADAYRAVATAARNASYIHGIFFWAWGDPYYAPSSDAKRVWSMAGYTK